MFLLVFGLTTAAHAGFGIKLGAFTSGGNTNIGGGIIYGLGLPLTGLTLEAELQGFYQDAATDLVYLQANAGPSLNFQPILFPDFELLQPYIRGGVLYGAQFYKSESNIDNQYAPGAYAGLGITTVLPVIFLSVEANYNYVNFDSPIDNDFWTILGTVGIRL
jgi:hypothetical protein